MTTNLTITIQELRESATALRVIGDKLISVADYLAEVFSTAPEPAKQVSSLALGAESTAVAPIQRTAAAPTLEDVRAILANLSQQGLTAQVRELLRAYGVERLSEVDPGNYPALIAEAKELASHG